MMSNINFKYGTRNSALDHATNLAEELSDWQGCEPNFEEYECQMQDLFYKFYNLD